MVKTIVWNHRASNSFNSIIAYLQNEWGERVTKHFVSRTYQIIDFLAQHPEMGTLENYEKQIFLPDHSCFACSRLCIRIVYIAGRQWSHEQFAVHFRRSRHPVRWHWRSNPCYWFLLPRSSRRHHHNPHANSALRVHWYLWRFNSYPIVYRCSMDRL